MNENEDKILKKDYSMINSSCLQTIGRFGKGELEFDGLIGIYIDKLTGYRYLTERMNKRIQILDEDWKFKRFIDNRTRNEKVNEIRNPFGICLNKDGRIYLADGYGNCFFIFDQEGKVKGRILTNSYTYNIIPNDNDQLIVSLWNSKRLGIYSEQGELIKKIDISDSPVGFAFNSHQELFIGGGKNIIVLDKNFEMINRYGDNKESYLHITIDKFDRIILSSWRSNDLQFYNSMEEVEIGGGGGYKNLVQPAGICLNGNEELEICEFGNNRLIQLNPPFYS